MFMVVPIPPSTTKLINIDKGMARPTKREFLRPKKKSKTNTTKMTPKTILFSRLSSCIFVCSDWSFVIDIFRPCGKI